MAEARAVGGGCCGGGRRDRGGIGGIWGAGEGGEGSGEVRGVGIWCGAWGGCDFVGVGGA